MLLKKKHNCSRYGFSLLTVVIYLALISLMVMYVMQWVAMSIIHRSSLTDTGDRSLALVAASDLWMRDMRTKMGKMHTEPGSWIWNSEQGEIAWQHVEGKLLRSEGSFKNGTWHQKSQSLMAEHITSCAITYDTATKLGFLVIVGTVDAVQKQRMVCKRCVYTYEIMEQSHEPA